MYVPQWLYSQSCRVVVVGRCEQECKVQRSRCMQQLSPGGTAQRRDLELGLERVDLAHGTVQALNVSRKE